MTEDELIRAITAEYENELIKGLDSITNFCNSTATNVGCENCIIRNICDKIRGGENLYTIALALKREAKRHRKANE